MPVLRHLNDLRFIIGVFFGIVGVILMATGATDTSGDAEAIHLNLVSGAAMFLIAATMLALSLFKPIDFD
jgi:hypothetical protein